MNSEKQFPNMIICGMPSVGKTRLCQELLKSNKQLTYVNVNDLVKNYRFIIDYDNENECDIIDDDALNDYLNSEYFHKLSGVIVDYHSPGIIHDSNLIQGVFVLRCNKDLLNERLITRNYSKKKQADIIDLESFQTCLNEACEAFYENIVYELQSNTEDDLKNNIEYLTKWIDRWPLNDMEH